MEQQVVRQRDFSGGEADEEAARRDDSDLVRAAGRQMSNKRVLPSGAMAGRPGRRILHVAAENRCDEIRFSSSTYYRMSFGEGTLIIRNSDGSTNYSGTGYPWANSTVGQVVWDRFLSKVFVCFPGMRTKVLTLANGTWSVSDFSADESAGGQKRMPFYRFSPTGITLTPSALVGTVDIEFSSDVLTAGYVGTRIRYQGRQMTVATVVDGQHGTATVDERLFPTQRLAIDLAPEAQFSLGETVEGATTGAKGVVSALGIVVDEVNSISDNADGTGYMVGDQVAVIGGTGTRATATVATVGGSGEITGLTLDDPGSYTVAPSATVSLTTVTGAGSGATADLTFVTITDTLEVVLTSAINFDAEVVVGPNGKATSASAVTIDPGATTVWDEEIFNDLRGWPGSVFVDQNRLGFTDIPALGHGIAWSAIEAPTDLYPGGEPDDAIFELLKGAGRVFHVIAGDDQFVFSDIGVFYVPISETNPLKPGSVVFRPISALASSSVRPSATPQGLAFIDAGGTRVMGIRSTGQQSKSYVVTPISDLHSHLITDPVALASGADDSSTAERYVFLLNATGVIAVGRYDATRDWIGWMPWRAASEGAFKWVSAARGGGVLFTTAYPVGSGSVTVAEALDVNAMLDAEVLVNAAPAALAPSPGLGPLWFLAGATVYLVDDGYPMGTRVVDGSGNLVAIEGEDLSGLALSAGFRWEEVFEPFVPHAPAGKAAHQSLRRRKFSRIGVTAKHNSGYVCAGRRVPTWRMGVDSLALPPPLREKVELFRKTGRAVDPTFEVLKDIPGTMIVTEVGFEVTV